MQFQGQLYFKTIYFSINTQSTWPIDRILKGATTPGHSRPGSDSNKRDASHSPKLPHYWNLSMRLFSVISRTLVARGGVWCLCRESSRCILQSQPTGQNVVSLKELWNWRFYHSGWQRLLKVNWYFVIDITKNYTTHTLGLCLWWYSRKHKSGKHLTIMAIYWFLSLKSTSILDKLALQKVNVYKKASIPEWMTKKKNKPFSRENLRKKRATSGNYEPITCLTYQVENPDRADKRRNILPPWMPRTISGKTEWMQQGNKWNICPVGWSCRIHQVLLCRGLVWFVGLYGISTFVGYLTPNTFLCK